MLNNYLAGIRCFTYNQSRYIEDALNGFVIQQTTFPYITMIVDDASTDGGQTVISSFVDKHFDISNNSVAYQKETEYAYITFAQHKINKNCYFVILYLKENHYQKRQYNLKLQYLAEWRDNVKYEALCEGDDYWTDPMKLQMQVDFLEANSEYGMCYTKVRTYLSSQMRYGKTFGGGQCDFSTLFRYNQIPTMTVVLRLELFNKYYKEINPICHHWKMGDYPMWLWFAYRSKIKCLDRITGVYRILSKSASHSSDMSERERFIMSTFDIKSFYADKFRLDLDYDIDSSMYSALMTNAMIFGDYDKAIEYYDKIKNKNIKTYIKYVLCKCPFMFHIYQFLGIKY